MLIFGKYNLHLSLSIDFSAEKTDAFRRDKGFDRA